jgi:hypothetical protein
MSDPHLQAQQLWCAKEKREIFFLLLYVFFKNCYSFLRFFNESCSLFLWSFV